MAFKVKNEQQTIDIKFHRKHPKGIYHIFNKKKNKYKPAIWNHLPIQDDTLYDFMLNVVIFAGFARLLEE